jgi:hypothetical protein
LSHQKEKSESLKVKAKVNKLEYTLQVLMAQELKPTSCSLQGSSAGSFFDQKREDSEEDRERGSWVSRRREDGEFNRECVIFALVFSASCSLFLYGFLSRVIENDMDDRHFFQLASSVTMGYEGSVAKYFVFLFHFWLLCIGSP